jgi:hypothetical protein
MAPGEENQITPQAETSVSSIALPPFWGNRPELWFSMAEAKFNLASTRITKEETKFYHVLTVLSPEIAAEVADVITTPDSTEPYTRLKEAIIERLSLSETQKLKQLLSGQELGSRKPSQLLRHMKSLVESSNSVNEQVLRELFLQQMPPDIKPILISLTTLGLKELAEIADKILETTPSAAVASTTTHQPPPKKNGETADTADIMLKLLTQMEQLTSRMEKYEAKQNENRTRSRSRSRSEKFENCWYHHKFGEKANKCAKPCAYSKNGQEGQK